MRHRLRCQVTVVLAGAVAVAGLAGGERAAAKAGRPEVRAVGTCGHGASAKLRLRTDGGRIDVRFEVDHTRPNVRWQVAVIHERRLAYRGAARTVGPSASFELHRDLPDLPGADAVTARAWGPDGLTCVVSGVI